MNTVQSKCTFWRYLWWWSGLRMRTAQLTKSSRRQRRALPLRLAPSHSLPARLRQSLLCRSLLAAIYSTLTWIHNGSKVVLKVARVPSSFFCAPTVLSWAVFFYSHNATRTAHCTVRTRKCHSCLLMVHRFQNNAHIPAVWMVPVACTICDMQLTCFLTQWLFDLYIILWLTFYFSPVNK